MQLTEIVKQQIETKCVLMSPDVARMCLDYNENNRRLNMMSIRKFADDMRNGRWQQNGETIKFDREGRLIDGQHRLHAIILANVSVELLVVSGLEPIAQQTIDIGQLRSSGQIASLLGVRNATEKAALAAALIKYQKYPDLIWSASAPVSKTEIVNFILDNEMEMAEALSCTYQAKAAVRMPRTPYGVLAFNVLATYGEGEWLKYHDRVIDGVGLQSFDPRLILRNYMMRRESSHTSWTTQQQIGVVIKSWNMWRMGKPVKQLFFRQNELPLPKVM
jgi:hypothetical protein